MCCRVGKRVVGKIDIQIALPGKKGVNSGDVRVRHHTAEDHRLCLGFEVEELELGFEVEELEGSAPLPPLPESSEESFSQHAYHVVLIKLTFSPGLTMLLQLEDAE